MFDHVCLRTFRGNLLVVDFLQHDSILDKYFSKQYFSKIGMTIRNPQKNLRKGGWERTGGIDKWEGWSRLKCMGQVGQGQGDLHIGWDRMWLGQGVLQIRWERVGQWTSLCPAELVHLSQSGTTRA